MGFSPTLLTQPGISSVQTVPSFPYSPVLQVFSSTRFTRFAFKTRAAVKVFQMDCTPIHPTLASSSRVRMVCSTFSCVQVVWCSTPSLECATGQKRKLRSDGIHGPVSDLLCGLKWSDLGKKARNLPQLKQFQATYDNSRRSVVI